MLFLGYVNANLIPLAEDIIYNGNGCVLFSEEGEYKLAIEVKTSSIYDVYALFLWEDYKHGISSEECAKIINGLKMNVAKFYAETVGLVCTNLPNTIRKEAESIIKVYHSDEKYYENGCVTAIAECPFIKLDCDFRRKIWFLFINGKPIALNNENAAKRLYDLFKEDLLKYIRNRWWL